MAAIRKNWFVTVGGIIGLFSGLPTVWGTAVRDHMMSTPMPGWLYVLCMFSIPLSIGIIGIGAKGQDEHSTFQEVEKSSTGEPPAGPPPSQPEPPNPTGGTQ